MKNVYLFVFMTLTLVTYSQEKVIDTIKKKEKKFQFIMVEMYHLIVILI